MASRHIALIDHYGIIYNILVAALDHSSQSFQTEQRSIFVVPRKKTFPLFECFTLDSFKVGSDLVRVDAKVEPIFVFIFIFGFVFVFIGT